MLPAVTPSAPASYCMIEANCTILATVSHVAYIHMPLTTSILVIHRSILSLIGVVAENWGQYQIIINPLISLFLLVLAIVLLVARIVTVYNYYS